MDIQHKRDPNPHSNAVTDADSYGYACPTNPNSDAYSDAITDTYSDRYANADLHAYYHADYHSDHHSDAHANFHREPDRVHLLPRRQR